MKNTRIKKSELLKEPEALHSGFRLIVE